MDAPCNFQKLFFICCQIRVFHLSLPYWWNILCAHHIQTIREWKSHQQRWRTQIQVTLRWEVVHGSTLTNFPWVWRCQERAWGPGIQVQGNIQSVQVNNNPLSHIYNHPPMSLVVLYDKFMWNCSARIWCASNFLHY